MSHSRNLSQLPPELLLLIAEELKPRDLMVYMIALPSLAYIMPKRLVVKEDRIGALLHYMAENHESAEVCRRLIPRMEIDVNATPRYTDSYLESAIRTQHTVMVDLLLARPDIKINGWKADRSALYVATMDECIPSLKKLLARPDVNVNARKRREMSVLAHAAAHGRTEGVRLLLKAPGIVIEPDPDTTVTPLSLAADAGHTDIVKLLLPLIYRTDPTGVPLVDINARSWRNKTALIRAVLNRQIKVVQQLVKHNHLQMNARDDNGRSALSYAAEVGHLAIMRRLLGRQDIDVNVRDPHGRTPLSYAAAGGFFSACRLLVEHPDIEPHAVDQTQRRPLIYAVLSGNAKVFRLLLKQCTEGEQNLKDHTGRGAWHYAESMNRTKMMEIFSDFQRRGQIGNYDGADESNWDITETEESDDSDAMDEGED